MDVGICIFPTDRSIQVADLARAVEDLGFESLWVTEHSHIPTNRATPWPGGRELPDHYKRTLDPFVALTTAAAVTTRLRLGFGILLLVQRDPIITAKALASLDHVSGGRLMCGVGGGWNKEEMMDHGTDPATRFHLLAERVRAMRELWTQDVAEFHGDFVTFGPSWSWPKPIQNPFPVLLGGNTTKTMERVIDIADGWFPSGNLPSGRDLLVEQIIEFRALCAAGGRERLPVTVFAPEPDATALEQFEAVGVDRVVFSVRPTTPQDARSDLESLVRLVGSSL